MGQIGGILLAAAILGNGLVLVWFRWIGRSGHAQLAAKYHVVFLIAGGLALLGALAVSRLAPPHRQQRPKLVLKRRYSLFYVLCLFYGARKQIFLTFGPWVLVRVFHQSASTMATLLITANLIGVFFQPQLGRLIDRVGERRILMFDAAVVVCISLGYAFAHRLPLAQAISLIYVCYVLDSVIFACSMARSTYLDKIAENETDVHASLSVGVSLDHAVSMSLPILGGLLWDRHGYPYVFLIAAALALCNLLAASRMRVPQHAHHAKDERPFHH